MPAWLGTTGRTESFMNTHTAVQSTSLRPRLDENVYTPGDQR